MVVFYGNIDWIVCLVVFLKVVVYFEYFFKDVGGVWVYVCFVLVGVVWVIFVYVYVEFFSVVGYVGLECG